MTRDRVELAAPAYAREATAASRRRLSTRALATAATWVLVAASFIIPAFVSLTAVAAPLTVDLDSRRVVTVTTGSYVWALDVRPGQGIEPWPADAPDSGVEVDRGGSSVGIPATSRIPVAESLVIAALLVVVALVCRRLGLPGASVALGWSSAAALGPLTPALGFPTALPLAVVPVAVASAALASYAGAGRRKLATPVIAGIWVSVGVVGLLAGAVLTPELAWPWELLWSVPAVAVLVVGLVGSWAAMKGALAADAPWRTRGSLLKRAAFPLARSSRIEGSAEERARLATELHNEVLPELGQAILELDASDPAGRARLDVVSERIRQSLSERQSAVLKRAGLAVAVGSYADGSGSAIPIHVEASPAPGRAPESVELAAYRVAQLAIGNAIQHSGADSVRVLISESPAELHLDVVDDGVGLDETAERLALARGHIGLAEMRAQAENVGATLAIAGDERGTRVGLTWKR